jgi:GT2 family glycosyltransferase
LKTILRQNPNNIILNIVVVNNYSEENTLWLNELFPEIKLIINNDNIGFGAAINQALVYCHSKYVILLNPDCLVTDGFIDASIRFMDQNDNIGILGPMILDEDGGVQGSAQSISRHRSHPYLVGILQLLKYFQTIP